MTRGVRIAAIAPVAAVVGSGKPLGFGSRRALPIAVVGVFAISSIGIAAPWYAVRFDGFTDDCIVLGSEFVLVMGVELPETTFLFRLFSRACILRFNSPTGELTLEMRNSPEMRTNLQ